MKYQTKLFYPCLLLLIMLTTSFRWPLEQGRITSTFGESRWDHFHDGVDMISSNSNIYPVTAGKLVFLWDRSLFPVENYPGSGNYRVLEHDKGSYSVYMHLADGATSQELYTQKDILGIVGNTGHSLGKHLHFCMLKKSERMSVNPYSLLPTVEDSKEPIISEFYIRINDRYFLIRENSNIRLTQQYPLLVDIHDRIRGGERLGIYRLLVQANGKKVFEIDYSMISFVKNELTISSQTHHDLFDEKGYYKIKNIQFQNGINNIIVTAFDYSGNKTVKEISFNIKREFE